MAWTPVQKEISRIAADYRRYIILKALSKCWLGFTVAGLIVLVLHWFFGVSIPHALPVLAGAAVLTAGIIIARRGRLKVALREIARRVERDDPQLNSLLLAALEQEPDAQTGTLSFLQLRVIRQALEANRKAPWHQRFTERLFFAQGTHFALLAVAMVVLSALAFAVREREKQTAFRSQVQITPGNAAIEKGSAVAIVAQLAAPAASGVRLVFNSSEGGEQSVAMARSLNDPLYGFTLPSVAADTKYYVEYDGVRSAEFALKVFEHPELQRADAELKYPDYTRMPEARIEDTRRITAVEGTDVQYTFYLNKPVRSAKLIGTNKTELVLTNLAAKSPSYALSFPLTDSGRYKLQLVDEEGRTNKLPADFVFVALRNEEPKLKLQSPRGDQRVSALQEVRFEAETQDDFGVSAYGIAYTVPGKTSETISLTPVEKTNAPTRPHEARLFAWTLPVESLGVEPGELVSYYLWAEDLGPDGKLRRSQSDMYFAEVRPFEEIFRPGSGGENASSQQQQGQGNNSATKLLELQKEIVSATWNLQRREKRDKPSPKFAEDAGVVRESQSDALSQARELQQNLRDEKSSALAEQALTAMSAAEKKLGEAAADGNVALLPTALDAEQTAYQALLKLQAREYQVNRNRSQGGGGGEQGGQRAQRQLEQLEFQEDENRYETQSQASPLQSPEQRESLQVLNRLKELARRQEDMSERLKELQSALNEAKTEKEREELERQLKRLQEEQQQIVQDMDEVRQRMAQPENQSRMAEARQQLDQTRQQSRDAARQLENQNLSQALSSSSRAEQELRKLSDEFRKSTSNQFSEEMREMREQARNLDEQQEKLAQKMEEMKDSRQRSLADEGPRQEVLDAIAQQRAGLTNLLQNMRQVTEQAENAEPLLSRQLYESLRRSSQENPEKNLEITSQLLERNFLPQAAEAQQKAGETIRDLRESVERAAEKVLGDEAESLRFAERELQDLAERAERELNALSRRGGTNGTERAAAGQGDPSSTNRVGVAGNDGSTNRVAAGASREQRQEGSEEAQTGENGQARQAASNQEGAQQGGGGRGENQSFAQDQSNQAGQQQGGENQRGEPGQQGRQGQSGQQQAGSQSPGRQGSEGGERQRREGEPGGENNRGGSRNFFEQWANAGGDGGGTGGTHFEGPFTGADYTRWTDRLRDIEEILQDPELRTDVARIREMVRNTRMEFKRHAREPQWNVLENEVLKPLRILQNRVAEQLARHGSREAIVPVDRDPVPQKYADAVSRYYERLGKE